MPTPLLGSPKSPPTPLLLALLISHTLHLTPSAHPGEMPAQPCGGGAVYLPAHHTPPPPPWPSPTGHLLSCRLQALPHLGPLSRCSNLGSRVGLSGQQGCSQTQQLTDTILHLPLGGWGWGGSRHPGATLVPPDLPGHLAWAPVPCTRTTSSSSLVLSLSPNPCSPDPRRPPALWSRALQARPPSLPAGGTPGSPPLALMHLLLPASSWRDSARGGEGTPHPAPTTSTGLDSGGTALGWHLLWRQRVKAKLPGLHPSPIQADVLANPQHPAFSNLILALLQKLEEKNSCPLALRKQFGPPPPAMGPPGHCEDPCPSGTLGHPVWSTLSPPHSPV